MNEDPNNQNTAADIEAEAQDDASRIDGEIPLPSGQALPYEETYGISAVEPTTLVVLAGAAECGKTTLVTSLYQRFLKKPPEKYYFAGSRTLQGFEQRAYLTRMNSFQTSPQTQRTARGAVDSFLHLRIWESDSNKYKNLLLSDFSGEDYNSVSANVTLAKENFGVVKAAKVIVMLIDGETVSNKRDRQAAVQKSISILRTFHDAELVNRKADIIIAISKYDIVHQKYIDDHVFQQYIDNIPSMFCKQIASINSQQVGYCKIAAMPCNSEILPVGYGLEDFFSLLINPNQNSNYTSSPTRISTSEFNLFGRRILK